MAQKLAKGRKKVQYNHHQLDVMSVLLFALLVVFFFLFILCFAFLHTARFFRFISELPYQLTFLRNQLHGWLSLAIAYH